MAVDRKMGREVARRREVEVRRAAMVKDGLCHKSNKCNEWMCQLPTTALFCPAVMGVNWKDVEKGSGWDVDGKWDGRQMVMMVVR